MLSSSSSFLKRRTLAFSSVRVIKRPTLRASQSKKATVREHSCKTKANEASRNAEICKSWVVNLPISSQPSLKRIAKNSLILVMLHQRLRLELPTYTLWINHWIVGLQLLTIRKSVENPKMKGRIIWVLDARTPRLVFVRMLIAERIIIRLVRLILVIRWH